MHQFATQTALTAGKYLLSEFKKISLVKTKTKTKYEIVTPADLGGRKNYYRRHQKKYPAYQILLEESGFVGKKSDYLWIIDPLDGTTNFAMENPLWAVSIGLWYRGKAQIGVVYAPVLEKIYTACLGGGAYLGKKRLAVSKKNKI